MGVNSIMSVIFNWLKSLAAGPVFVSHCKTKHSRAEVLISVTVRGGGGFVPGVRNLFRSIKQILFARARLQDKFQNVHI